PAERLRAFLQQDDRASRYAWDVVSGTLCYAATVAEEIAEDLARVDDAMRWGWNWELGPFEQWDALGVEQVVARLEAEGRPVPKLARRVLAEGGSFYRRDGEATRYFQFGGGWGVRESLPNVLVLKDRKAAGKVVRAGPDASLVDLGEDVLCLELHTRVNVMGPGALEMLTRGLAELERNWAAMVIGNQGRMFSAGANLTLLLASAEEGDWDDIHAQIRQFQNTLMAVKCSPKPVVAAVFNQVLGGGCELSLQSTRIQASAETYIGLVELAVGLIPGGGGCKEMVVRSQEGISPMDREADRWQGLHRAFQNIGLAKTSGSAAEAREMGFLRPVDRISVNPRTLLGDARELALSLVREHRCYEPREDILVLGEPALARFKLELHLMHRAGHISEHDKVLGTSLATILTGGPLTGPRLVSEQHLLDLEREEFARLCGYEKTRERIRHMLKTNRPLRN
ncbi:MAG: enoyl-CoA hydratase/isomerase family protein, partial [Armatimonadetes bacterium]|nr:enoyl-CoA hydratase/isomerase family protein [Armatimonadota bacterium]